MSFHDRTPPENPILIAWRWYTYPELSKDTLYDLLQMRQQVFVVEQRCYYQDLDGHDREALHLIGWAETLTGQQDIVACLRLLAPGLKYPEASIGRVALAPSLRGRLLGQELMQIGIERVRALYPQQPIRISAQKRLESFYNRFGFVTITDPYDDIGITHVDMVLPESHDTHAEISAE